MSRHGNAYRTELGSFIVDRRGTVLGFDHAMEALTGWPAVEVVGRNKETCGRLAVENGEAAIPGAPLYQGQVRVDTCRQRLTLKLGCRDGRLLETDAVAERLEGPGGRARVTVLAVLTLSAAERTSANGERYDPLTSMRNAEAFREALEADVESAARAARPLALILADVDRLRRVNDRLGRSAGDDVLRKLAGVLRVAVPDHTRIFRLADDDFAVLLPGAGRGDARQQAAALRSIVERYRFFAPEAASPSDPPITLSLGAASFPADAEKPGDLVGRAAEALDEARSMGRNRVWCYLRRPRVPLEVPVFFDGEESLLVGFTRDLSPSGIFVHTAAPIDIGMRCALSFPLPGHEERVHVIGRVVRAVPPEPPAATASTRVPGMGVEFERFGGAADRRAIEAFLHGNEAATRRPEVGPLSVSS